VEQVEERMVVIQLQIMEQPILEVGVADMKVVQEVQVEKELLL
jgi:hypothetical protein